MFKIAGILVFLLFPLMKAGEFVEFGIKLKEFRGVQDELILGKVFLYNELGSNEFKDLVTRCLEDYMSVETRTIDHLEGEIKAIGRESLSYIYELSGDAASFQTFLGVMLDAYYADKYARIELTSAPVLRQVRAKRAKIGEIVNLEHSHVFTRLDQSFLNHYTRLGSFGEESNDSSSETAQSEMKKPLLSKASSELDNIIRGEGVTCDSECCDIS